MFNQKVNGIISSNPGYLNGSYGAPYARSLDIHNCGTTIQKFTKKKGCNGLPLQEWCSKESAVESFGMRPIVNSKEYFENIKTYLASIIYTDSIELKKSNMSLEEYYLISDTGDEPFSSLIQAVNLEVTNKLMYYMATGSTEVKMFNEYNPLCEGFVITDIDINTYRSTTNDNHYYHTVIFSAVNTTRYNTITFTANAYQDTTSMMDDWNSAINKVTTSQTLPKEGSKKTGTVYISFIDFLNNTTCVTGQENECEFKGYSINKSPFSQFLNEFSDKAINWLNPNSLPDNNYDQRGNYDEDGKIKLTDSGPSDFQKLIKDLGF